MSEEGAVIPDDRLLRSVAEQLKEPLMVISRTAELVESQGEYPTSQHIQPMADMAVRIVDGFLLASELYGQQTLELEPVPLGAVLEKTAHALLPYAKQRGVELEVQVSGRYGPAMAHRGSFEQALLMIGYSLIGAGSSREVAFGLHKSKGGLVAGVFSNNLSLNADVFRRGKALFGTARQAMPEINATAGTGIFVADSLITHSASTLKVAQHNNLRGLAATLMPSAQLKLV